MARQMSKLLPSISTSFYIDLLLKNLFNVEIAKNHPKVTVTFFSNIAKRNVAENVGINRWCIWNNICSQNKLLILPTEVTQALKKITLFFRTRSIWRTWWSYIYIQVYVYSIHMYIYTCMYVCIKHIYLPTFYIHWPEFLNQFHQFLFIPLLMAKNPLHHMRCMQPCQIAALKITCQKNCS